MSTTAKTPTSPRPAPEAGQRFKRPPRLRFRNRAVGKTANDGLVFPYQEKLNPENLTDYFPLTFNETDEGDEGQRTSIRTAFNNMYDVYSIYHSWCPSQELLSVSDPRMLWRQAMLMIASALDTNADEPLTRVICWSAGNAVAASATSDGSGGRATGGGGGRGVVIDIEDIKLLPSTSSSEPQVIPVLFVRFAELTVTGPGGIITEEIAKSMADLPTRGLTRTICCTSGEIDYILKILVAAMSDVTEVYRKKWEKKKGYNKKLFRLSMLRPPVKPSFPLEDADAVRRAERAARKADRKIQREKRGLLIAAGKAENKKQTILRREQRAVLLEKGKESRLAIVATRKADGEAMNKMCHVLGCQEIALIQCSQCKQACYCGVRRKSSHHPAILELLTYFAFILHA